MASVNETDMSTIMTPSCSSSSECPPAPLPLPLSLSLSDTAAYDTVVRQLVSEFSDHLPPLEPLEFPLGIQRQQAVMTDAVPICSPLSSHSSAEVFHKRRETDIEGDLTELNTCESLSDASDSSDEEAEETEETEESSSESEESSEEVISHNSNTDTSGVFLSLHRQKQTGNLAFSVEAPIWMWGALVAVVTTYMWMIVFMLKNK